MKLLTLMLVGWLAVAVAVEAAFWNKDKSSNFKRLNAYLVKSLPNNDNLDQNLAYIKSNMHQMTGDLQAAGQMMIDLNEPGDQCTGRLLAILLELANSGLSWNGNKRVERLLKDHWLDARETCMAYLWASYRSADNGMTFFFAKFVLNKPTKSLNDFQLDKVLQILASGSKYISMDYNLKTRDVSMIKHSEHFDDAFNEYLVKPCQSVVSDDELFKTMSALVRGKFDGSYINDHFDNILITMNWARKNCNRILGMDEATKNRIFKS